MEKPDAITTLASYPNKKNLRYQPQETDHSIQGYRSLHYDAPTGPLQSGFQRTSQ